MMLTVEERLRLCHQGTAWHGDLIKKQLTELAELLAASERSDAESLAMYRSARDRADHLQREIDEIKQTEFPRRVEKVAGVLHAKVKQLTEAESVMRRNAAEWQTEAKKLRAALTDCVRYIRVYADPEVEGIDPETVETAEMLLAQYPALRKV